jgi:predicted transcriptional regulator
MRAKWYSVCGIHQTREPLSGACPVCAGNLENERALANAALSVAERARRLMGGGMTLEAAAVELGMTRAAVRKSLDKRKHATRAEAKAAIAAGQPKGRATQRAKRIGLDAANCAAIAERRSWERADEELRRG